MKSTARSRRLRSDVRGRGCVRRWPGRERLHPKLGGSEWRKVGVSCDGGWLSSGYTTSFHGAHSSSPYKGASRQKQLSLNQN